MLAAGILAKNTVEKGLKVKDYIKTSLPPESRMLWLLMVLEAFVDTTIGGLDFGKV